MVAEFINPYTFIPLPAEIGRRPAGGHHRAVPGAVSGRMRVSWTLQTPLLLPKEFSTGADGGIVVPGSSVKGAVRSLHEALMGGCLRVVDGDFVPVYREPAVAKPEGPWRLAVVESATGQGRATAVRLADPQTAWVPVEYLAAALGRPPKSGDRIGIDPWAVGAPNRLGRREVADRDGVFAGDEWVVVVGDSGTRQGAHRFFVAAGLVGGDRDVCEVPGRAWDEYEQVCQDTNDLRLIRQDPEAGRVKGWRTQRIFDDVRWKSERVGQRRIVTGKLWPGDVVWVNVAEDGRSVLRLSMAAIWRVPGQGVVNERIPEAVLPCDDPQDLCLSCRLFGSAAVDGAQQGAAAEQHSYAGHLRFGDAVSTGPVRTQTVRLAPMLAPRPGAGQFYLRHTDLGPAQSKEELPGAAWGSRHDWAADGSGLRWEPRPLAGRKFYWHGDPAVQQPPRHVARGKQTDSKTTGDRQLAAAGTVLTQTVAFDNVPPAELASLLLALLPGLLLPATERLDPASARYALHLGGGKPLGLGSCTVEVSALTLWGAADRYAGQRPATEPPEEFFARQRQGVGQLAGRPVLRHWPTLSRILRTHGVEAGLLWYPLGGDWDDPERRDQSYEFFAGSNGRFLKDAREIVPLPDPNPIPRSGRGSGPFGGPDNPRQVLPFPPTPRAGHR